MAKATKPRGLGPRSLVRTAGAKLLSARLADVRKFEDDLLRGLLPDPVHDMRVAIRRRAVRGGRWRFGVRDPEQREQRQRHEPHVVTVSRHARRVEPYI